MESPKTSRPPIPLNQQNIFRMSKIIVLVFLPFLLVVIALLTVQSLKSKDGSTLMLGTIQVKVHGGSIPGLVLADGIQAVISPTENRFMLVKEKETRPGLGQQNLMQQTAQWVLQPHAGRNPLLAGKKREVRVRLGDVVYGGLYSKDFSIPVYMAAISDERFDLIEPSASAQATSNVAIQAKGGKQAISQDVLPDERESYKTVKGKAAVVGKRTTSDILASGIKIALLKCEQKGWQRVGLMLPDSIDGLPLGESLGVAIKNIGELHNHLRAVERVSIILPRVTFTIDGSETPVEKVMRQARETGLAVNWWKGLVKWIVVPEPLPGGQDFLLPQITTFEIGPETSSVAPGMFNNAGRTRSRVILWPFACYLLITLVTLFWIKQKESPIKIVSDRRLIFSGVVSFLVFITMLCILGRFWKWWPDSWLSTIPVMSAIGLLISILNFYLIRWITRPGVRTSTEEVKKDSILQSVLYSDCPVEDIADDRLGFQPLVDALRRFLDNRNTKPPMVMSVNGPWGSGKSSFMKILSNELKRTGRFTTVWFNAWQYHKEEQILAAFLKTITTQLSENWGIKFKWRMAWVRFQQCSFWQYFLFLIPPLALIGWWLLDLQGLQNTVGNKNQWVLPGTSISLITLWVMLKNWGKPFKLQFERLYTTRDQSWRIGFIDEFTREFKLFREAVGDRKFFIVIDDLDRCPPDKVVEVLKTINIIINSGNGAGQSFFLLGYDRKYILKNIEINFQKFINHDRDDIETDFGEKYLKKMVNLSISIPLATPDGVQKLVTAIDKEFKTNRPDVETNAWLRLEKFLKSIPAWRKRLAGAVTFLILLVLIAGTMRHQNVPEQNLDVAAGVLAQEMSNTDRLTLTVPVLKVPQSGEQSMWLWLLVGSILLGWGVGFVILRRLREDIEPEMVYTREEEDTEKFVDAIKQCKDLLPKNPRDMILLINRMRVEYLIQAEETWERFPRNCPFSGPILQELDCVIFSLLQQRYPKVFSDKHGPTILELLKNLGIKQVGMNKYAESRTAEQSGQPNDIAHSLRALVEDLEKIIKPGEDISTLFNGGKMQRYLEINRFILG